MEGETKTTPIEWLNVCLQHTFKSRDLFLKGKFLEPKLTLTDFAFEQVQLLREFFFVSCKQDHNRLNSRCLKITEKVSFNIVSEASYVYILSGQKLIKNAKNGPFWRVFEKPEACGQKELPTGQF